MVMSVEGERERCADVVVDIHVMYTQGLLSL